jgi:hypothetical protein
MRHSKLVIISHGREHSVGFTTFGETIGLSGETMGHSRLVIISHG